MSALADLIWGLFDINQGRGVRQTVENMPTHMIHPPAQSLEQKYS